MDVMFYEVFAEEAATLQRYLPGQISAGFSPHTIQASGDRQPPAKLISIRTQSLIPPAWAARLAGVLTRSTGYDHVLAFQQQHAVHLPCGYLPCYCSRAVAEQALLMLLALMRKLPAQLQQFAEFHRDGLTGIECRGRGLLVIGVGRIGTEVARLAAGIGMRVQGVDLVMRMPTLAYVSLDEGIRWADALVCALPLTRHTAVLLNYDRLRHAKRGAIFVNISRGEISPVADLKRLLDEGVLGGLGLDVFEEEHALAHSLRAQAVPMTVSGQAVLSLQTTGNVLLTPHNAFNTQEALERKAQHSADSVVAFLRDGAFPDPVPADDTDRAGVLPPARKGV